MRVVQMRACAGGVWNTMGSHTPPLTTMTPEVHPSQEHKLTVEDPSSSKNARVQRAQWLRAAILGANDGVLSVSTLMLGVGSAHEADRRSILISGIAGAISGAFSMALGEYASVSTQKDIEEEEGSSRGQSQSKTVEAEAEAEAKGQAEAAPSPYRSPMMRAVATVGGEENVLPSPIKAAAASGLSFMAGSAFPLFSSAFVRPYKIRVLVLVAATTVALVAFGGVGARLGGSRRARLSAARMLVGGWLAMGITYWSLKLFDADDR